MDLGRTGTQSPPVWKAEFERDGYCIVHNILDTGTCWALCCCDFVVVSLPYIIIPDSLSLLCPAGRSIPQP